jgi:hypothetical protein
MNWEKITTVNANTVALFFGGVLLKNAVTYVFEGGLTDDYPMSRCLFYIVAALIGLLLLASPHLFQAQNRLTQVEKDLSLVLDKLDDEQDS